MQFRYSRWDDTQDPFGPDVGAGEILEALSDEVLMGGSAERALKRLLRRGMKGKFEGIDAIRRRLRERRQVEETALNLAGPLDDIRRTLEEIVEQERSELATRPDEDARAREAFLDALPPDAPGQIRDLQGYRFADPVAQRSFDELMGRLREQVLGAHFRAMASGMRGLAPEQLARFRDMLAELNAMIEKKERGRLSPATSAGSWTSSGTFSRSDRKPSMSCSRTWRGAWPRSRA